MNKTEDMACFMPRSLCCLAVPYLFGFNAQQVPQWKFYHSYLCCKRLPKARAIENLKAIQRFHTESLPELSQPCAENGSGVLHAPTTSDASELLPASVSSCCCYLHNPSPVKVYPLSLFREG